MLKAEVLISVKKKWHKGEKCVVLGDPTVFFLADPNLFFMKIIYIKSGKVVQFGTKHICKNNAWEVILQTRCDDYLLT